MRLADLLRETLDVDSQDVWENERTPTPVRCFGVRLHSIGLSVRETSAVLGLLGVERSHGAIWQWTHRLADSEQDPPPAQPARVAVDETAVKIDGEWQWLYAAVDLDSLYLLDCTVFSRHGTDPAAAFLHRLTEKYDLADTEFLVDAYGYRTALSRLGLSGRVEHADRNHIEKWFHTFKMRSDRFHTSWVGSRRAVTEWCQQFRQYYNQQRPNQALDGKTPVEVLN
ncbi:IS6 family transposase [Haloarcula rubripromontorii]|uniref:Transposase n=1 Tax=Haloarcula rubripromontorii TaxID=1705562 RepID=A0A0M9AI26_9EURY|nr:IS6 family transposase [Haloarcula rubripromontorii]KOX92439.1 transposase [Haloarcula rubripromontorii]